MEDQFFELLEKMYIEIQEMKTNMATKQDIAGMATKQDIANMATKQDIADMATKQDISNMATKQDIVRLENRMDANHRTLYDGYKQTMEGITEIKDELQIIKQQIEDHEIRLRFCESAIK